jgi:hypothetical protein
VSNSILFLLEKSKKRSGSMAGELGFEPRLTESESAVLPLNYSPVTPQILKDIRFFKMKEVDVRVKAGARD